MNSLVQEAQSIAKAIELAWIKAGEPQKFSVRIYERPEKNFLGMIKKQAKIGLLFEKRDVKAQAPLKKHERPLQKKLEYQKPQHQEKTSRTIEKPKADKTKKPMVDQKQKTGVKQKKEIWSEPMIQVGTNWMEGMLKTLNKSNVKFSVQAKRYHLKILLESPVAANEEKEKMIFRNCAHLIMQTIRNKFKKQFHYHKVVISSVKP